jgi:isopentenyl-diphosphate delta-isomerase
MKIQIVNDQDNLVGLKERTEIDYINNIYRVSALWLTNSKGQTLLAKRAAVKDKDPGKWGPAVAGTIDEGETYDDNIYKEAIEEIGLEGAEFTKGLKIRITHPRNYFCQWYFVTLDRDADTFVMQEDEVDELEWVDIEQMKQELKTNTDKYVPAMQQIIEVLGL